MAPFSSSHPSDTPRSGSGFPVWVNGGKPADGQATHAQCGVIGMRYPALPITVAPDAQVLGMYCQIRDSMGTVAGCGAHCLDIIRCMQAKRIGTQLKCREGFGGMAEYRMQAGWPGGAAGRSRCVGRVRQRRPF